MKEKDAESKDDYIDWLKNDRNFWRAIAILFIIFFIIVILLQIYSDVSTIATVASTLGG